MKHSSFRFRSERGLLMSWISAAVFLGFIFSVFPQSAFTISITTPGSLRFKQGENLTFQVQGTNLVRAGRLEASLLGQVSDRVHATVTGFRGGVLTVRISADANASVSTEYTLNVYPKDEFVSYGAHPAQIRFEIVRADPVPDISAACSVSPISTSAAGSAQLNAVIENRGTAIAIFPANSPLFNYTLGESADYSVPAETAIIPGESKSFSIPLNVSRLEVRPYTVRINLDPRGVVRDASRENNRASCVLMIVDQKPG